MKKRGGLERTSNHRSVLNTITLVGIDVGIKKLAVYSDGNVYKNINKSSVVRKIEKKLK